MEFEKDVLGFFDVKADGVVAEDGEVKVTAA